MIRRFITPLILLTALTVAAVAPAAEIAPDLREVLDAKAEGELVRVLWLFDDRPDFAALDAELGDADHVARRAAVLETLRHQFDRVHAPAIARLEAVKAAGRIEQVNTLLVANAVNFLADADALEAMAADKALPGALHHDTAFDPVALTLAERSTKPAADAAADATAKGNAWSLEWIDADHAWALGYTGTGIVVGHIDSGVYITHPDIANNLWTNTGEIAGNMIDDDLNGYIDDIHGWDAGDQDGNPNDDSASPGHGTHTAGTVCGDGTGGTVTGVAPDANIMSVKAMDSTGSGTLGMIWEGYDYLLINGARVITMSLGVPGSLPPSYMRTERENMNLMRTAGILLFNSAGNDHFVYDPPIELGLTARCPAPWNPIAGTPYTSTSGVVAVGGTGFFSDSPYTSSSTGPVNWGDVPPWYDWPYDPGDGLVKPDVSAPGVNVNSLSIPSGYTGNTWSGTSMSCPHAAGLAALMLSKNPGLSPAGMDSIMEQTSVDLGTPGKDNQYGSGRIDADAAVAATPLATTPHLTWVSFEINDASGDDYIDPGESFDVVFTVVNNSGTADGTGVAGSLVVAGGDPLTVDDGAATFGTIAMNGGTGDNASDVFSLTADGGAAQGTAFTMYLTLTAQNGYTKVFDVTHTIGLPEYDTHDVGNVMLTVTDCGSLGFMSSDQIYGFGFGPSDANGLYIGSFWGGNSSTTLSNHDYYEGRPYDWVVSTTPNGRVKNQGNVYSDQDFEAFYDDSGCISPLDVLVSQESFAFADAPNDDFVIVRYTVHNQSASDIVDYYGAIFCDFDIGSDAGANASTTLPGRRSVVMYNGFGDPHYGITVMGDTPVVNLHCLNNPTDVYPNGYILPTTKWRILNGFDSTSTGWTPDDWSVVASTGPFTIPAGGSVSMAFALVWGIDQADFYNNADAAKDFDLDTLTGVDQIVPGAPLLAQNSPNPFNPMTAIQFNLERAGHVRLGVYDLMGRQVATLVDRHHDAGSHRVIWSGMSDAGEAMPSGMYLYRVFTDDGRAQTKKMMLVR